MKLNMFKTIVTASVMTVAGAALPAVAAENLHVNVPFSFMVGSTKLPAGEYNISQSDNGMMTLSGTKASAMILTVPSGYGTSNATGLSFSSSASNAVLTGVQVMGSFSREIPNHAIERKASLVSSR